MSLDYQFSPIDVNITTHPKAFAAGVEAMGLWMWGMAHARQHRTEGRLHRAAVLGAWGGRRNVMLAKRLVTSGLWILRDDGDWEIWNFEKKGAGRVTPSAERMRRFRAKGKDVTDDVTPCDAHGDVTTVTSCSTSTSKSLSGSDLSLGSDAGTGVRARVVAGEVPDWFSMACESAAMAVGGEVGDRPARWVEYEASRTRKGWAMDHKDAVGWLATVVRSERAKASSRPAARGAEATKQPYDPDAPWLKLPEVG